MSEETKEQEILSKVKEMLDLNMIENIIQSNEQVFDVEGITYKVTRPTYKQRQESYKKKIEKYTALLQDKSYLLEEDLKKIYLSRGIDTDEILKVIRNKSDRRNNLMLQLGEALTKNSSDTELNSFKEEIKNLNAEIQELSIKRTLMFETSLEQQVMIHTVSYLTYLVTQKKDGENWIRAWNTYEEFENASEKLINQSTYYMTLMAGTGEM